MGKHHDFVFGKWDLITERVNDELNSPGNLLDKPDELKGQHEIPFLEAISVEKGRLFEVMGVRIQKDIQRKNIENTASELGSVKRKWRAYFFASRNKAIQALRKQKMEITGQNLCEYMWPNFLKYTGKKMAYRLRGKSYHRGEEDMTNGKVLSRSMGKELLNWVSEEGRPTPLEEIEKKKNNLYGYANGLRKKVEGILKGSELKAKRDLCREIEADEGSCSEERYNEVLSGVLQRIKGIIEVDKNSHLGK